MPLRRSQTHPIARNIFVLIGIRLIRRPEPASIAEMMSLKLIV